MKHQALFQCFTLCSNVFCVATYLHANCHSKHLCERHINAQTHLPMTFKRIAKECLGFGGIEACSNLSGRLSTMQAF